MPATCEASRQSGRGRRPRIRGDARGTSPAHSPPMRHTPAALLFALSSACSSGTIDPAATGIRLELSGDASGLYLRGTPLDPDYVGSYSNPRQLLEMRVDLMADGRLRTSCDGDCSDPPFVT